jgi:hypothetical protein
MTDDTLREAFQSLAEHSPGGCSADDLERIWKAVSGELPAQERHEVVARLAESPAWAEAWRIAEDLWRASEASQPAGEPDSAAEREMRGPAYFARGSWLAAAAVVLLGITATLVFRVNAPPPADEFRAPGMYAVESALGADAAMPRDAFRLRWTPGPEGSRYTVRVTTENLTSVASGSDLSSPEYVVPPEALANVASGSRVLWQVDVTLPDGGRASSPTFVTRVN